MKNIRFKNVCGTHVLVHTSDPPTDADWTENMAGLVQRPSELRGIFVYTMGGGPNAGQRSIYNVTLERLGMKPKVAVLSGSTVVRGIMTAFNWIQGGTMKLFSLGDLAPACDYLGVSSLFEQRAIEAQVEVFKRELGIGMVR